MILNTNITNVRIRHFDNMPSVSPTIITFLYSFRSVRDASGDINGCRLTNEDINTWTTSPELLWEHLTVSFE